MSEVHESYPHKLLDPTGEVHKELMPGEIHILTPPISPGNYTLESPNVWTGYIKPIIRVTRRLKQFPIGHFKLKTVSSVTKACPTTAGQYSITHGTSRSQYCSHPGTGHTPVSYTHLTLPTKA